MCGCGRSSARRRLEGIWRRLRRQEVFPATPLTGVLALFARRAYLVDPLPLRRLLERHLPFPRLELTRLAGHVVATDILNGLEVRLSQGDAASILLASTAIPGLFPALELGATRVIVLPTGFPCAIERPPEGPVATALHALNLLIARQLAQDIERFSAVAQVIVIPPLCPLTTSSYDFSQGGQLIDRAAGATGQWLSEGGLTMTGIPQALQPHHH